VSRKAWQRGDIVAADVRPTPGRKQQAQAPAIVVTQAALNRLGMTGITPLRQTAQAPDKLAWL
jgi:mRNA-degrading endonuclease toxin of MazEF toxin-antitoxin module